MSATGGTPPSGAVDRVIEWDEVIDGKPQKFSAKESALRTAFRREGAVNRTFSEFQKQRETMEARFAQADAIIRARDEGRFTDMLPRDMPIDRRIQIAGEMLRADLEREKLLADPRQRELIERAEAGDKAAQELLQIKAQQRQQAEQQAVQAAQHRMGTAYKQAMGELKIPVNDVTVALMAQADRHAREQGWQMSPQQLATETHRMTTELFDRVAKNCIKVDEATGQETIDDDAAVALLGAFPTFQKVLHRALIVQVQRRKGQNGLTPVPPKQKEPAPEEQKQPRVVNSVEEAKIYGTRGLRSI